MTDSSVEKMQKIAIVQAQVACALIRMEGMKAENTQRAVSGYSPAYADEAFSDVIYEECINHNAVMATLATSEVHDAVRDALLRARDGAA